jgi:hypothetical protein
MGQKLCGPTAFLWTAFALYTYSMASDMVPRKLLLKFRAAAYIVCYGQHRHTVFCWVDV